MNEKSSILTFFNKKITYHNHYGDFWFWWFLTWLEWKITMLFRKLVFCYPWYKTKIYLQTKIKANPIFFIKSLVFVLTTLKFVKKCVSIMVIVCIFFFGKIQNWRFFHSFFVFIFFSKRGVCRGVFDCPKGGEWGWFFLQKMKRIVHRLLTSHKPSSWDILATL